MTTRGDFHGPNSHCLSLSSDRTWSMRSRKHLLRARAARLVGAGMVGRASHEIPDLVASLFGHKTLQDTTKACTCTSWRHPTSATVKKNISNVLVSENCKKNIWNSWGCWRSALRQRPLSWLPLPIGSKRPVTCFWMESGREEQMQVSGLCT